MSIINTQNSCLCRVLEILYNFLFRIVASQRRAAETIPLSSFTSSGCNTTHTSHACVVATATISEKFSPHDDERQLYMRNYQK